MNALTWSCCLAVDSTIPTLVSAVNNVSTALSQLTPTSYVQGNATALINSVMWLSGNLSGIRGVLADVDYSIKHITDLWTVKDLLNRVKVGSRVKRRALRLQDVRFRVV